MTYVEQDYYDDDALLWRDSFSNERERKALDKRAVDARQTAHEESIARQRAKLKHPSVLDRK